MTTPDPGLPNLPEDAGYGTVIGPGEWNAHAERINDVEDANADDQEQIRRGTVATASATAAKVATLTDPAYAPKAGDLFLIEFTAGMAVTNSTLSINGSPALPIMSPSGSRSSGNTTVPAGVEVLMLHDGDMYRMLTGNTVVPSATTAAELQAGTSGTGRVLPATVAGAVLLVQAAAKPASATAVGRAGLFWIDGTGLYVCIATNTWRFFGGATF